MPIRLACRPTLVLNRACLRLLLVGLLFTTSAGQAATQVDYQIDTLAEGLAHPWSLAFLPDGSMLITEREGRLRIVRDGELLSEPVSGMPDVYVRSQAGLFDVLPDPEFDRNGWIYLAFAQGTNRSNATRVVRAHFDGAALHDVETLLTVEPAKNTPVHYGGRLLFLPDGTLLITTGDGFNYREQSQHLDSLMGKTLRIHPDGRVPDDNPFVAEPEARPEIWSYGHRNPQGLALDPADNQVYLHEHGPRGGDELHSLEAGHNYGWPVITYGKDYSGAEVTPFRERPGMTQPLTWWDPAIAPSGLAVYRGDAFPEWDGKLLVGGLVSRDVRLVRLTDDGAEDLGALFEEVGQRIRDVRLGPDGAIYLLTDSPQGRLLRVTPGG